MPEGVDYVLVHSSVVPLTESIFVFFFNDTATTEIYTLSLHDALPISIKFAIEFTHFQARVCKYKQGGPHSARSEEHTSELQSLTNLVCRLLLEKKKKTRIFANHVIAACCQQRLSEQITLAPHSDVVGSGDERTFAP